MGVVAPDRNAFAGRAAPEGMSLLPSGFALPPVPYLAAVVVALAVTVGLLYRRRPRVTPRVVAAFAPWMVAGAAAYALYQVDAVPGVVRPFFGNPIVYLTTFVLAGVVWLATADQPADRWEIPSTPGILAVTGVAVAGVVVSYALVVALSRGSLTLAWPALGLLLSLLVTAVGWLAIRDRLGVAITGAPGMLVLLGHTLDGVSTAVGDHLGYAEQTPLSRAIIEVGATLPTAPYLGDAWLFVVVKVALAVAVLWLVVDYVREEPAEGSLVLGFVAAVGLGPGAHNLVLFVLA